MMGIKTIKRKFFLNIFLLLSGAFLFTACGGSGKSSSDKGSSNLPASRGEVGEILVVMDSNKWEGSLGKAIKEVFQQPVPGLPQTEPHFSLKHVNPFGLNNVLRKGRNMLFVTTLDNQSPQGQQMRNYFTRNSLEKIRDNPDFFSYTTSNEYASGQSIMHLFGPEDATLINNIQSSSERLKNYFLNNELAYLKRQLFNARSRKGIARMLIEEHGFYLRIPYGYEVAVNKENFVWIRQLGSEVDKSIYVTYKPYTSEEIFEKENIVEWRNEIGKNRFMEGDSVYMKLQEVYPLTLDTLNWKNRYTVESRGLWKMSNNTMGGPFLSYVFVDEGRNRAYYMEGFVYAPNKDKRRFIWEMEALMNSFEIPKKQEESPPS